MRGGIPTATFFVSLALLFVGVAVFPVGAQAAADNFVYPLKSWRVTTQHGEELWTGYYHMGIDAGFELPVGTEVLAMADGVVREAKERTKFGFVVLIEHTRPNGSQITSLYGHLAPSDVRVSAGQKVSAGEVIGVLGDSNENGGWSVHLHTGIHKEPYSSVWIYYGHVNDPETANDWFDPEVFIPKHLSADAWAPEVEIDGVERRDVVGEAIDLNVYATDIGSGVQSLRVRASVDGRQTWETLTEYTGEDAYPYLLPLPLSALGDGVIHLRVIAEDGFGNVTKETVMVRKKADAATMRHVAALSGTGRVTEVYGFYQNGEASDEFFPFAQQWEGGGDIAVGYVKGVDEPPHVVTVKNSGSTSRVKVFTKGGMLLDAFIAFEEEMTSGARVAVGDTDGDGVEEVVVVRGAGSNATVRVFTRHGELLAEWPAFAQETVTGIDVATGDVDGDGLDEIIVGAREGGRPKVAVLEFDGTRTEVFRAFEKSYTGGVNVATADVDGDGLAEVIVGSGGGRTGEVRVFDADGRQKEISYFPFGETSIGAVDVSSTDWEFDGVEEVMMSVASDGEAWVKTYRYDSEKTVLFEERVFEEGFVGGARIAGWE